MGPNGLFARLSRHWPHKSLKQKEIEMADATHITSRRSGTTTEAVQLKREALKHGILYRAVCQAQLITPRIFQQ